MLVVDVEISSVSVRLHLPNLAEALIQTDLSTNTPWSENNIKLNPFSELDNLRVL